ncbi:zinc finger and SCAN domain-containing protein 31-like [Anopheles funestus]|uniref:zinc finger and SCAN domain-containing protein 31-like n=1 Tax=Anopheles funestus TaxID=62324 RepID=UPI0020C64B15|nr:zinc finger and SCAN domain-containing protein 31-like [Anopheles funestus]
MDHSSARLISIKIEPIGKDYHLKYNENNIELPEEDICFEGTISDEEFKYETDNELENVSESKPIPNGALSRTTIKRRKKRKFCAICGKYLNNIAEHRRMHLNIRVQQCPYCDKTFVHRSNLYAHLNIHTQERIYKCEYCDSEFTCIQGLKQHRTIHFEGQYECTICNRKYNRKFYLRIHEQRVHMPKEKHKCLHCDREFLNPKLKEEHMKIHEDDTMQECNICHRVYSARKNLFRHIRTAHTAHLDEG